MIRIIHLQPSKLEKLFPRFILALSLSLVSCKDDPVLVKQRNEQEAEIRQLEGELALLYQQLEDAPEDQSAELERLKTKVASDRGKVTELEEEVADLEEQKRQIERDLKDYKGKYKIR